MRWAVCCPDCGYVLSDRGRVEEYTATRWECLSCGGEVVEWDGRLERSWELSLVERRLSGLPGDMLILFAVEERGYGEGGMSRRIWLADRGELNGNAVCSGCGFVPAFDGDALLRYTPVSEDRKPVVRYFLVCKPCYRDLTFVPVE